MITAPTPLELLDRIWLDADGYEAKRAYMEDLRAFLSRPAVQALADPALAAAAAVLVTRLPELLRLHAIANFDGVPQPEWLDLNRACAEAIHAAAQAAKAQEEK